MNTLGNIKADRPSQIIQIDYTGPLFISENKLYAYTIVDTWSVIGLPYTCRKSDKKLTIGALKIWIACYSYPDYYRIRSGHPFCKKANTRLETEC